MPGRATPALRNARQAAPKNERRSTSGSKRPKVWLRPAQVCFQNLRTGRSHTFGRFEPEVLRRSFFGGA